MPGPPDVPSNTVHLEDLNRAGLAAAGLADRLDGLAAELTAMALPLIESAPGSAAASCAVEALLHWSDLLSDEASNLIGLAREMAAATLSYRGTEALISAAWGAR